MKKIFYFALILIHSSIAYAKLYSTPYLDYELPDSFSCVAKDEFFECQDHTKGRMSDSLFTVAFKKTSPQDSLSNYLKKLSQPFSISRNSAPPLLSIPLETKKVSLNGWDWVESVHYQSHIPNYYTYFWGTTRGAVSTLVQFSVHKSQKQARYNDINQLRISLKSKPTDFAPLEPTSKKINPQPVLISESGLKNKKINIIFHKQALGILVIVTFLFISIVILLKSRRRLRRK